MRSVPKLEFLKIRDFSQRLNVTFEFVRQNFVPLVKCLAIIVTPLLAVSAAGLALIANQDGNSLTDLGTNPMSLLFSPKAGILLGAMFLLVYAVMSVVVYSYVKLYITIPDKNTFSVDEIIKEARKYIIEVLFSWVAIVSILALLPLLVAAVYLLTDSAGLTFFLGFIVFFPLAYVSIPLWNFLVLAQLMENLNFVGAFKRAFAVVSENWWPSLGFNLTVALLQSLIGYLFYLPLVIYWIYIYFTALDWAAAEANPGISAALTVFYYLGSYLLQFILLISNTFQYHQLVEEHDSVGLLARITLIGQPVALDWDEDY